MAAKSTFWPLCYEALDRLEETRGLIEKGDVEPLADSLEKCGSWLSLAASAAMTEGKAGIADVGMGFVALAQKVRDGNFEGTNEDLQNCITVAEICMAKSHIIRAETIDDDSSSILKERPNRAAPSAAVKEANLEIQANQNEARRSQYQYDAQQIERHLRVAQTYLTQAAESGQFELSETFGAPILSLKTASPEDAIEFIDQIRSRLDRMLVEGETLRGDWVKKVKFLVQE